MTKIITDKTLIDELLTRGVEEIIDKKILREKLLSGKKLRIKLGIDPTSPNLHLGRSIPLLKLRDFQELGHQIVFIIGDFTALIGDTSDKESERPMLDSATVQKNLSTYIDQASKIIDTSKAEIHHNNEWLKKLDYMEIGKQADAFSLSEFISRENIAKRLDEGKRVSVRELLYPLMQGYDSVKVKSDIEIGGTDQRFNLLAGRDLQRLYGQTPQDVITNPLIEGTDGRKMSSSFGNSINLNDSSNEMFGKIMSLKDELLIKYFVLLTRLPISEINEYETSLNNGRNPRDIKIILANTIVAHYHGADKAREANQYFVKAFTKKEIPDDIPEFSADSMSLIDILIATKMVSSKSEARRLVDQSGVKINSKVCSDLDIRLQKGDILQKGKIHFLKII